MDSGEFPLVSVVVGGGCGGFTRLGFVIGMDLVTVREAMALARAR